jgi:predicted PurR-regulated permease PerM
LVYLLFLIVLITVLVTLAPVTIGQANRLSIELERIQSSLEQAVAIPVVIAGYPVPLDDALAEIDEAFSQLLRPTQLFRVLRIATSNLVWVLMILVAAYHLLHDWVKVREWLVRLAPEAYQPDVRRLHDEVKVVWRSYLRGQLVLMLTVGVLTTLASAAVGLRGAVALGLLAGGLDLIPSLGPTAALVVAASLAWFNGSTHIDISHPWFTLLVIVLFNGIQLVENLWLQPRIMGRVVRLHAGVVFVAVVGALASAGALAALIIVPVLGSARIVGRYLHKRILGLPPWPDSGGDSSHRVRHTGVHTPVRSQPDQVSRDPEVPSIDSLAENDPVLGVAPDEAQGVSKTS